MVGLHISKGGESLLFLLHEIWKIIFTGVILLRKGETDNIKVTLTEKQTITDPNYLFVFSSGVSDAIAVVYHNADDQSLHKSRYNQFSLVVDDYFDTPGQYTYRVYEQSDLTVTTAGKNILETGIAIVKPATVSTMTQYSPDSSHYTVYNG